jgi:hypothetical protein
LPTGYRPRRASGFLATTAAYGTAADSIA